MRRVLAVAGNALAATVIAVSLLAGCTDRAITDVRLQSSVSHTFANLWILQQAEQGHPILP